MDLQRAIDDYIVCHEVNRHSATTIAWYRWNLGTFDRWLRANRRPTLITAITVGDARAFLQAEALDQRRGRSKGQTLERRVDT